MYLEDFWKVISSHSCLNIYQTRVLDMGIQQVSEFDGKSVVSCLCFGIGISFLIECISDFSLCCFTGLEFQSGKLCSFSWFFFFKFV